MGRLDIFRSALDRVCLLRVGLRAGQGRSDSHFDVLECHSRHRAVRRVVAAGRTALTRTNRRGGFSPDRRVYGSVPEDIRSFAASHDSTRLSCLLAF